MSFDTSLIDVQNPTTSFSTTESSPSDPGAASTLQHASLPQSQSTTTSATPPHSQAPPENPPLPVRHLPTQETYNCWSPTYDTDANMLLAIDDLALTSLLPTFLSLVLASLPPRSTTLSLLDLGCGTGRTTAKLLAHEYPRGVHVCVTAHDFLDGMLDVARRKLGAVVQRARESGRRDIELRIECADCFPAADAVPDPAKVDAVLSTLVLEHIPLPLFFSTLAGHLAPGSYALLTNMHSDMGAVSQAGFVDASGVKVRGTSFAHTVRETGDAAEAAGFEVVEVRERSVSREDVESGRVGRRGVKWMGVRVWFGMVVRRV